jgi:two-component system, sensor histidine kinase and response regulator
MKLKGRRIFIVEDNAGNLAIMTILLEREGAKVGFARWGTSFLEKLLPFMPIDLILLDLALSDKINGYQVFEQIRTIEELCHIPVAIVTAADPDIEMSKARDKGLNGFISKPIKPHFPMLVATLITGETVWGETLGDHLEF